MKPLSPGMVDLLKVMKAGATVRYSPYMGRFNPTAHYYCRALPKHRCTKAAEGLLARGLVKRTNQKTYSNDHDLELSDEGRRYDIQREEPNG